MQQGNITKSKSKTKNILKGILGEASGFDTPPSSLSNLTDGKSDTFTGQGSKVMGGAGVYGYITFDLGSLKTILLGGKFGIGSSSGSTYIYLEISENGVDYYPSGNIMLMLQVTGTEVVGLLNTFLINTRYFRLRFRASAASTCTCTGYELRAYEMG